MQLKNVYEAIDALAPFALSGEYCDTYGVPRQQRRDARLRRIGAGDSLLARSLGAGGGRGEKAGGERHLHPSSRHFHPLYSLRDGAPLTECAKAGISVISAHLNLDSAQGGIDEELMLGLGGMRESSCTRSPTADTGISFPCMRRALDSFLARVKARFSTERVIVYGDRPVCRVASFCGAGMDETSVAFAVAEGADTFLSSDGKHHLIAELVERGLNVILLTHYAAENYGFIRFVENLKTKLKGLPIGVFTDERLL